MHHRIVSTQYLGCHIAEGGVPIIQPPGGHAIYIDAKAMLPHIRPLEYPGQALCCELYNCAVIRTVEIRSVMFGRRNPVTGEETPAPMELVRLAIPRRVYTDSHGLRGRGLLEVHARRPLLRDYRLTHETPFLRHFSARFEPL